ncbi:hypothetical protein [Lichenicoccus roseus]|uniref:Uncharacterized protein n=1 Tax=Lichenicoccus roseus TaxID=2683649 RepID=A0A5R9JFX6_9PROT|nr:hypothetical protein [Lichenicoccus roseus]TLU73178.1 hypothetical protein FE263_07055 [Lichenicoccus roseus]
MDKNVLFLLGAVGALASAAPARAEMATIDNALTPAASYADLLKPIPNALQVLHSEAAAAEAAPQATAPAVQDVQLLLPHHHHHHHRYHRRRHYHHHHHRPY